MPKKEKGLIHSFAEFKKRYYPDTEEEKQRRLMALSPEEFGRYLADEWAQAMRKVIVDFLEELGRKRKRT